MTLALQILKMLILRQSVYNHLMVVMVFNTEPAESAGMGSMEPVL